MQMKSKKQPKTHSKHIIERKPDLFAKYLLRYSGSLHEHREAYAHLFFQTRDPSQIPMYLAYLCPLCVAKVVILSEDGYFDNGADFTLDHFPPQNVGGSQTILVCRTCNSKAGQFENGLRQKMQDRSFDKGIPNSERKIRSNISAIKGSYPGSLIMGEENKINISFKDNDNIHAPLLDEWIATPVTNPDWTAEIKYFVADEQEVTKSLLKTAYLYCFQYWGYNFCFSETGKMIRDVLEDKRIYPMQSTGFWLTEQAVSTSLPAGLCTLEMPRGLKSFCVNVLLTNLKTKHQEIYAIIIPGPDDSDFVALQQLDQLISEDPNFNISLKPVKNFSITEGHFKGYIEAWKAFTRNQTQTETTKEN